MLLQVDKATSDLKNTNVRLKETLFQVINQNECFNVEFPTVQWTKVHCMLSGKIGLIPKIAFLPFTAGAVQQKLLYWHLLAVYNSRDCFLFISVSSIIFSLYPFRIKVIFCDVYCHMILLHLLTSVMFFQMAFNWSSFHLNDLAGIVLANTISTMVGWIH